MFRRFYHIELRRHVQSQTSTPADVPTSGEPVGLSPTHTDPVYSTPNPGKAVEFSWAYAEPVYTGLDLGKAVLKPHPRSSSTMSLPKVIRECLALQLTGRRALERVSESPATLVTGSPPLRTKGVVTEKLKVSLGVRQDGSVAHITELDPATERGLECWRARAVSDRPATVVSGR